MFQAAGFVIVGGVEISHAFGLAGGVLFLAIARSYSYWVAATRIFCQLVRFTRAYVRLWMW